MALQTQRNMDSLMKQLDQEMSFSPNSSRSEILRDYTTTVTILECIKDGILFCSAAGNIEYANQSALNSLGKTMGAVVGQSIDHLIGGLTSSSAAGDASHQSLMDLVEAEAFGSVEAELLAHDGKLPALLNFSVIPNLNGSPEYLIITIKELSYHKALEREVKQQQALSVSHDRLRALGEMSVGLAHELGQPLAAVELLLECMQRMLPAEETESEDMRAQIKKIQAEMARVTGIVNRIRSFAQHNSDLRPKVVNINEAIYSAFKLLEYEFSDVGVHVELDLEEKLPPISTTQPLLEQVIVNLLINTMDAYALSERQRRLVTVRSSQVRERWLEIRVEDEAGGIDPSIAKRVFEPFFSTRDPDEHSGTGLSVARNIVQSLGGDLSLEVRDSGSSFRIRIPIPAHEERTQLYNLIELLHQE